MPAALLQRRPAAGHAHAARRGHAIQRSTDGQEELLARQADGSARPLDPRSVMALQRSHGNELVQRLIQRSPDDETGAVQRDDETRYSNYPNTTPIGNQAMASAGVTFYKFHGPATRLWFNPENYNKSAFLRLQDFKILDDNEQKAQTALNVVETHAEGGGDALAAVKGAGSAIGKRARGKEGSFQNTLVEQYIQAVDEARESIAPIKKARGEIKTAMQAINTVFKKQEAVKQEDVVKEAEEREKAAQAQVDKEKEMIGWFFDNFTKIIDPTEWKGLAIDGGLALGKHVAEELLVNTDHLEQIQKEVAAAKAKLKTLQSEVLISEMAEKKSQLETAQTSLKDAKAGFLRRLDKVRRMEENLTETLSKSKDTKGAAAAITERGNVGSAALVAGKGFSQYVEQSTEYLARLKRLDDAYLELFAKLRDAHKFIARDQGHFEHLDAVALANRATLAALKSWVEDSQGQAKEHLAYLAKGEFMQGYNEIPDALHGALAGRNLPAPGKKGG